MISAVAKGYNDSIETDVKVYISWTEGTNLFGRNGTTMRREFSEGTYLIGNSSFAAIRIGAYGLDICARLLVTRHETRVTCLSSQPTIFVDGRKLSVGESVVVGDMLELTIGRVVVRFMAAEVMLTGAAREERNVSVSRKSSIDLFCSDISGKLLEELNLGKIDIGELESDSVRETVRLKLRRIIAESGYEFKCSGEQADTEKRVFDEVMGLGPLESLLADPTISEIMVNAKDQIFIERDGRVEVASVRFSSDQSLLNVIERIASTVGRRIDTSSPIVDARLLDGSRVNAVIPPISLNGPTLTIRRFSKIPITMERLVKNASLSSELVIFLQKVVSARKNLIVSGGTGSGKTTLLNALSAMIPSSERIITIEDAAELQLQQIHVVRLEARPANIEGAGAIPIRSLVRNTLRMRPDRIIVGECRGGEALDMLQAMNTGHDGSLTTAHANSPEDLLRRIETMALMADVELPLSAIREQIVSAVCLVIQQSRLSCGRRLVTKVSWVRQFIGESQRYVLVDLFQRDAAGGLCADRENIAEFCVEEEVEYEFLS